MRHLFAFYVNKNLVGLGIIVLLNIASIFLSSSMSKANTVSNSDFKIATINRQQVFESSTAFKGVQEALAKQHEIYQNEISGYDQELFQKDKELHVLQKKLSEVEFVKLRQAHEKRFTEVEKIVRHRSQRLSQAHANALSKIQDKLDDLIKWQADRQGISLVLNSTLVAYCKNEVSLNDSVLESLNKELPHADLDILSDDNTDSPHEQTEQVQ